jgi:hypothetical protein
MHKVIVSEFITLDGVIQSPGYPDEDPNGGFEAGGWQQEYFDDVLGRAVIEGLAGSGGLLLGRRTYEIFAGSGRRPREMTRWPRSLTASRSMWCRPR